MGRLAKISHLKANRVNKSFSILINLLLHLPLSKNRTFKNDLFSKVWWKQPRKSATAASGTLEWVLSIMANHLCHSIILSMDILIHHSTLIYMVSCHLLWECTILLITICTVLLQTSILRLLNNQEHLQKTPRTSNATAWSVCKAFSCICSISSAKGITWTKLTAIIGLDHQLALNLSEVLTTNAQEHLTTGLHAVRSNKDAELTLVLSVTMRINSRSTHPRSKESINSNKVDLRTATKDFKVLLRAELALKIQLTVLPEVQLSTDLTIWSQLRNHCTPSNKIAPAS